MIEAAVSEKTRAIMIAHTLGNPFDLAEVMRDIVDADGTQPFVMSVAAMAASAQADDVRAGCDCAGRPHRRILQDRATCDIDAQRLRSVKIDVRRRLAALHMLAAAEDPVPECIADAEMVEMPGNPGGPARRRDGAGKRLRE